MSNRLLGFTLFALSIIVAKTSKKEKKTSTGKISIRAASHFLKPPLKYAMAWVMSLNDQYSEENKSGKLPLAIAENKLMQKEMISKINEFSKYSTDILFYAAGAGMAELKVVLAKFLTSKVFSLSGSIDPVNPDSLCVSCGVTALLHELSILLFEPGDAVLVPTPYYPAFDHDFFNLSEVSTVEVNSMNRDISTTLTEDSLEESYVMALKNGKKVKALLLTNPSNPLGTVYTVDVLLMAVQWARSHNLHIIVDEIYALSVFEEETPFVSIVSLLNNKLGNDVHVLWGMSKDFCFNGLRLGVLYSHNSDLLQAIGNLGFAFTASNLAQELTAFLLKDDQFVDKFITDNRDRLKTSYLEVFNGLTSIGIPVVPATAGMFCFVDLRELLLKFTAAPSTYDEKVLAEEKLQEFLVNKGIILTPGSACHSTQPGYFRICYAWVPLHSLSELIRRFRDIVQDMRSS